MSMTIVVTRNVPNRFIGFLSSCMLQLAPGVFVAPRMRKAIRERAWTVLLDWSRYMDADAGVVMFWRARDQPSGLGMRLIGWPKRDLVDHEGVWLTISDLTAEYSVEELQKLATELAPEAVGLDETACESHLLDRFADLPTD